MNHQPPVHRTWADHVRGALDRAGATIRLLPCWRYRVSNSSDFLTVNRLSELKQHHLDRFTHDSASNESVNHYAPYPTLVLTVNSATTQAWNVCQP